MKGGRTPVNKRRILSRVLLAAATAALIFRGAFLLYFGDFYHEAQKAFPVPGLSCDFVPQGLESFGDGFLISGYLSRSGRARLYHMDALGGVSSLELYREDGTPLRCHAGGVAAAGDFVYLIIIGAYSAPLTAPGTGLRLCPRYAPRPARRRCRSSAGRRG